MARKRERGIAIVIAILALALISGFVAAVTVTTSSELTIAASFRAAQQAFYAADAAAQWAAAELAAVPAVWEDAASGARQSTFVDGPIGTRTLPDGEVVDLTALLAMNPGWRAYAHGPLDGLLPASAVEDVKLPHYLLVLVMADPATADRLKIRAVSCGPRGGRRVVELALRRDPAGARLALP